MSATSNAIAAELEEVEDERDALLATLAEIESINQESIPAEVVWRLSDAECPVTVWREYRGMTIEDLAGAAGLSTAELLRIEAAPAVASFVAMAQIARVLRIDEEDLLPVPPEGRAPRVRAFSVTS